MVIKTLIVNTMPRRSAEDIVSEQGGVLHARGTRPWNPFRESADAPDRDELASDEVIPDGMEGNYYH